MSLYNSVIELDSCSNPQKMQQAFSFCFFFNCQVLDLGFFVGDITSRIGLGSFGPGCLALELETLKSQSRA